MDESLKKLLNSLGPEHGIIGAALFFAGGLINQFMRNRKEIQMLEMTTEQKNFILTLAEATTIRKELRETVERLQKELNIWQKKYHEDLDVWKKKYYEDLTKMREDGFIALENMKKENFLVIEQIKKENINLASENGALRVQITDIKSRGWIPKSHEEAYTI